MKGDTGRATEGGAGGDALLESLYRRYVSAIYTLCRRLLADARAAEEVTVAVFVRLGRELKRRVEESQILARLRQLAIEESLSRLGERGTQSEAGSSDGERGFRPSRDDLSRLDGAALDALAARLPDRMRVAFVLHDGEGLSDRAVAAHLRTDQREVRRLVHSARAELRRLWRARRAGGDG